MTPDSVNVADQATAAGEQRKYGSVKDVAAITNISESQLNKLRLYKPEASPPFFRIASRVLYPLNGPDGLDAWAAQRVANRGAF